MGHAAANRKQSNGKKKAKTRTQHESWAAGTSHCRDLCSKVADGTINQKLAAGLSCPQISKELHPNHNPAVFNAAVRKVKAASGALVGENLLSFLFHFAFIVISLVMTTFACRSQ